MFLSNKSFQRFEQHIIFKLMTSSFSNSIASTATDNVLLIIKQWKVRSSAIKKYHFFKYIFQKASQLRNYPICKTDGTTSWGCTMGNVGVKFGILLLYEAVSATVSLIPRWRRESEEGGSGSPLYRLNFNMRKFELLYLRNFYLVIQNMNSTLPMYVGSIEKLSCPFWVLNSIRTVLINFNPLLTRAWEFNSFVIFSREIVVK